MLENNPQSRFQVISYATALPGSCVTCGTNNGPFIDWGLTADFYGAVFFCIECAKDLGRQSGLVDSEKAEEYRVQLELAQVTLIAFAAQVEKLHGDIDGAVSTFYDAITNSISSSPSSNLESNGESKEGVGESKSLNSKELGTFDSDSELTGVQESTGISSNSGSNSLFAGNRGN